MRAWACLVHGLFLATLMALCQLERLVLTSKRVNVPIRWELGLRQAIPEAGVALLFASLWLIVAKSPARPAAAIFRALFLPLHLLIYGVVIVDHHFFLFTGTRSSLDLVRHALANLLILRGVLHESLEPFLLVRLALGAAWLLVATLIAWTRPRIAPGRRAGVVGALLGFGLMALAGGGGRAGSSLFVELLTGNEQERHARSLSRPELVRPLYREPHVTSIARSPSFVVVILESVGAHELPPQAPPELWQETPNLAALGARSIVFDNAYAAMTHTSKMLVAFFTGMFPRLEMPVVESTPGNLAPAGLPRILGELGYRTIYMESSTKLFERWSVLLENLGFQEAVMAEELAGRGFQTTGYFGMDEMAMIDPARAFLAAEPERPFLLVLHTVTTHHPYETPAEPPGSKGDPPHARFRRCLSYLDGFLGAVLAALDESGRADDTVVVVVGDHGEGFGEHGRSTHDGVPYEEGVHVPLLMSAGRFTGPPRRDGALRHQIDFLPTVLDLAGASWDGLLPGKSLLDPAGHERVVSTCFYTRTCAAMREGSMKYVYHYGRQPSEAFDLASDPAEARDLASRLDPAVLRAAEERLMAELFSVDAFYAEHPLVRAR